LTIRLNNFAGSEQHGCSLTSLEIIEEQGTGTREQGLGTGNAREVRVEVSQMA
jgi:hypothetical protein